MTNLEAAKAHTAEGDAAMQRQDYAAAARDYTLAAEQLENFWREIGNDERRPNFAAEKMRRRASLAIAKRDGAPVIKIDGRIGGWQS